MTTNRRLSNNRVASAPAPAPATTTTVDSVVTELAITPDGRRIVTGGDWLYLQTTPTPDDGNEEEEEEGESISGSYRCRATNIHGQIEADIQVHVLRPLRVKLEPRRQVCHLVT